MYIEQFRRHFENYYGVQGQFLKLRIGPTEKLDKNFGVLEIQPNKRHNLWTYCSLGMSLGRNDDNLIEIFIYSPIQDFSLVELITVAGSYHRNVVPLNLHHTFNIGRNWLDKSFCDHCYISLPYLDGEEIEIFKYNNKTYHSYWLIPITEKERDFKMEKGVEALENLFEQKRIDYSNPLRKCLIE